MCIFWPKICWFIWKGGRVNKLFLFSILLISTLFFSLVAKAKSTQVIILGAQIQSTNKQEYLINSNNLIDAAREKGEHVFIGGPSEYEKEFFNHENVTFITVETQRELSSLLERVNKENTSTIKLYIHAHGLPTSSEKKPDEVKIILGRVRLGLNHLSKTINYRIDLTKRLRVVAPFCFSGSIHQLSMKRHNTCSASASDFRSPAVSEFSCFGRDCMMEDSWAYRFTSSQKSNPNATFTEHFEVAQGDGKLNDHRGSLSSLDFLKRIFQRPPYEATRNWFSRVFSSTPETTKKKDAIELYCQSDRSVFTVDSLKIEKIFNDINEGLLEHQNSLGLDPRVPEFVRNHYKDKFLIYSMTLEKRKRLFLELFNLGREAKKLIDLNLGDEFRGQKSLAVIYAEKLRIQSNELMEYFEIESEMSLINKLYQHGNKQEIKKFEELFNCEQSF